MKDKLYAIVITETKEILDPNSFKKYWTNYGSSSFSGLYGWRKPKKIYLTLGLARSGFAHIPEQMKPHLSIAEFTFSDFVENGAKIQVDQKTRKEVKEKKKQERQAKYRLEQAQREFDRAKKQLDAVQSIKT